MAASPGSCAFCSTALPDGATACPKCGYPPGGDFARLPARPPRGRKPRKGKLVATLACPHCGARVAATRKSCPGCGADAATAWKSPEDLDHDGADVPDVFTDEDYEEAVSGLRRRGGRHPVRWTPARVRMLVVGIVLVLALLGPALILLARWW